MNRISTDELRKLVTETNLPQMVEQAKAAKLFDLDNKPGLPKGVPQDFMEALFYDKYCAIPVNDGEKWRFIIIGPGGSEITDSRTGEFVYFDTYEGAEIQISFANKAAG